jgi:hypothetical protein
MSMKTLIIKICFALTLMMPVTMAGQTAFAAGTVTPTSAQQQLQCGANGAAGVEGCDVTKAKTEAANTLEKTVTNVVNVLSLVIGVLAIIMLIVGGFRYVSSGGKQESVAAAKSTILYAVIGVAIAALSQAIIHFVLNNIK